MRVAAKGEVAVTDAAADPDGRDPAPRTLDAPRGEVGDRGGDPAPAEPRVQTLVIEHHHRIVLGPDAEQAKEPP